MKSELSITVLLSVLSFASVSASAEEPLRLIAHRGGVVTDDIIENNRSSIEAAVKRGYWMVEVDIRRSKDGIPVAHHDPDFQQYYGNERKLSEMTWDEIKQLRATPGGERPLSFAEYVMACDGRVRLMLDVKGDDHPEAYVDAIEQVLLDHNLVETTYAIGSEQVKQRLLDRGRVSRQHEALFSAARAGETVSDRYFLFEAAKELTESNIKQAQQLGVPVVAALNTFHYRGESRMEQARKDIERMRALGVVQFQIDSVYDKWLLSVIDTGDGR